MAKWDNHRAAIREALKRQKRSTYWLAQQVAASVSRSNVYGYLAGTNDLSGGKLEAINRALGIRYTDE
jgi:hypothetical protein